jgi:hypothetical protein
MLLFVVLSVPLGCFCLWFAWQAKKVGRRDMVITMSVIAFLCFATALLAGAWTYLFIRP